jgi:hypothetical protein
MKKSTARLSVLAISSVCVAYVAWCARSFYLPPRELNYSNIPQEIRAVAPQLVASSGMLEPEQFIITRLINMLAEPHTSQRHELRSIELRSDLILVCRVDGIAMTGPRLLFAREASGWRHITEEEFEESEQAGSYDGG